MVSVNVELMAQKTGIRAETIREALSLSRHPNLELVTTWEEARRVYYSAPRGSELEQQALEQWESLLALNLELVTTWEEARRVYYSAPRGSELEQQVLKRVLELVTTWEEARGVYDFAPQRSELRQQALERIATFFHE